MIRQLLFACLLIGPVSVSAQADSLAHRLPFASTSSSLELVVANSSEDAPLASVAFHVKNTPEWLIFAEMELALEAIGSGEEALAVFHFDVDRGAPVGESAEVVIQIVGPAGMLATKTVHLQVEAPRTFSLSPNYPNPFNPSTTLAFELPQASRVTLTVYDVLGREIVRLADGDFGPGRHEAIFDARSVASGLYVARIVAESEDGSVAARIRRMTLLN